MANVSVLNSTKIQFVNKFGYLSKLLVVVLLVVMISSYLGTVEAGSVSYGVNTSTVVDLTHRINRKPLFTFPEGGRVIFPRYRLVALYGTPGSPTLGALGQQSLNETIARIKLLAKAYQPYSKQPILPTLEIITTVASATPTANNDYSNAIDPARLQPWITAAKQNGIYVVLDLQSGRSLFLPQAEEYKTLLEQPNVGLALDPEWSLGPSQIPLVQIGSASITDVNNTIGWLASLTKKDGLPQKLFMLQQFRISMLPNRSQIDTSYSQLAYVIQMDGQGTQAQKIGTWDTITQQAPPNVRFGWKNFYLKDTPVRSPQQTMELVPEPWYVSYE